MSGKRQCARTCSTGRVSTHGNVLWIATKCVNVFTHPLERFSLVPKTQISTKAFTPIWTESWNISIFSAGKCFYRKRLENYQESRGDNPPWQAQFDDSHTSWSSIVCCCRVVKIQFQSHRHERRRARDIWRPTAENFNYITIKSERIWMARRSLNSLTD